MTKRGELYTHTYQLLLKGFDEAIKAMGYRQTGNTYQNNVKEFLAYLENLGKLKLNKLKPLDMVEYYEYLSTRPNMRKEGLLSSSTIGGNMFAVDLFFDYLLDNNLIDKKILLPKHNRSEGRQRQIISIDEVKLLYTVCENKRDKAILAIAYGCGARRSEIQNLNVVDVQLTRGILIVRKGKFGKRREIPLSNKLVNDLKDYLVNERHVYFKQTQHQRTEAFLVNNKGQRMQGDHINDRLKELIEKTQNTELINKDITLHCLRHSIAVHLLDNKASIEFVREFMGHSEIDTVHVYARRRKMKQLLTHSR